jgi:hypothetical protein
VELVDQEPVVPGQPFRTRRRPRSPEASAQSQAAEARSRIPVP